MTRSSRSAAAVLSRAVAAATLIALCALAPAGTAQAHNYVVSSTPEAGSTVTELPERFSITTNAPLLDLLDGAGFAMRVVGADGLYFEHGCVVVEGSSLYTTATLGAPGDYRVQWQVVSEDGHTVSGEFDFTWEPDDAQARADGSVEPPTCPGEAAPPTQSDPPAEAESDQPASADIGDALWVGGALAAVALAAGVTFFVATRRRD